MTVMWLPVAAHPGRQASRRIALDAVLAGYMRGDVGIVSRTFTTSLDFQAAGLGEPGRLERWLGGWHRGKAALLLDLARAASDVAPHFVPPIVGAGHRYLLASGVTGSSDVPEEPFGRLWRRAAIGLLQRSGAPFMIDEHLDALAAAQGPVATDVALDPRLVLARAIAQERRCWDGRPDLARPGAGVRNLTRVAGAERVPGDPTTAAVRAEDERWRTCLDEAVARFDVAAAAADTRTEARVRGAWLLFQRSDALQALEWLDAAGSAGDDHELAYWGALIRGRVLDELERYQDAADAYAAALTLCPNAQSAGVGLALALFRLDRVAEADELARALRARTANVDDPWWIYPGGDQRFVDRWMAELRAEVLR
jgi:hypothetical protein